MGRLPAAKKTATSAKSREGRIHADRGDNGAAPAPIGTHHAHNAGGKIFQLQSASPVLFSHYEVSRRASLSRSEGEILRQKIVRDERRPITQIWRVVHVGSGSGAHQGRSVPDRRPLDFPAYAQSRPASKAEPANPLPAPTV